MRLSDESWIKVPLKLLRQHGLSKGAATVCCCIIDLCGREGLGRWMSVSCAEIAGATGYSTKTVKRSVLELERLELIEIRRTSGSASEYRLTGCVELCPSVFKQQEPAPAPRARAKRSSRRGSSSATATEAEYLTLVNRFPEDPLPGQLEFPKEG